MNNRMLVAMLEEYDKALQELIAVVEVVSDNDFLEFKDPETKDPDCHSIQTILSHCIGSGYTYANYIHTFTSGESYILTQKMNSSQEAVIHLNKMMTYTIKAVSGIGNKSDEEIGAMLVNSSWGVRYDVEQLLEHAIVHVLRHRRQIVNFIS